MNKIGNNLLKAWKSPSLIWPSLKSRLWYINWIRLHFLARWNGTQLEIKGSFRQAGKVRIQGNGKIIIDRGAGFGYALAASSGQTIVIQARDPEAEIYIGTKTYIMNGCQLISNERIELGDRCMIGPDCLLMDSDFHQVHPGRRAEKGKSAPIVLEDNVWLGARVTLLKGVHVGKDAIIASGAVVTKDVGIGAIVGGNPARNIGSVYARHN